jgi:hypothetical protein
MRKITANTSLVKSNNALAASTGIRLVQDAYHYDEGEERYDSDPKAKARFKRFAAGRECEEIYNSGDDTKWPCDLYAIYDFRVGMTDEEWETVLNTNKGYDVRILDDPEEPSAEQFLQGKDINSATLKEIKVAKERAETLKNDMIAKLKSDPAAFLARVAFLERVNGALIAAAHKKTI